MIFVKGAGNYFSDLKQNKGQKKKRSRQQASHSEYAECVCCLGKSLDYTNYYSWYFLDRG